MHKLKKRRLNWASVKSVGFAHAMQDLGHFFHFFCSQIGRYQAIRLGGQMCLVETNGNQKLKTLECNLIQNQRLRNVVYQDRKSKTNQN